jgi:hypothetical protein
MTTIYVTGDVYVSGDRAEIIKTKVEAGEVAKTETRIATPLTSETRSSLRSRAREALKEIRTLCGQEASKDVLREFFPKGAYVSLAEVSDANLPGLVDRVTEILRGLGRTVGDLIVASDVVQEPFDPSILPGLAEAMDLFKGTDDFWKWEPLLKDHLADFLDVPFLTIKPKLPHERRSLPPLREEIRGAVSTSLPFLAGEAYDLLVDKVLEVINSRKAGEHDETESPERHHDTEPGPVSDVEESAAETEGEGDKTRRRVGPGRTARASNHTVIRGMTTQQAIMDHFTFGASFEHTKAGEWLEALGYEFISARPALSQLVEAGYLKREGRGRYTFVRAVDPKDKPLFVDFRREKH